MKKIREFLEYDYRKKALKASKGCLSFEGLCDYIEGDFSPKERMDIESHLAGCYYCLDRVISLHDGANVLYKKRRYLLKKELLFLFAAVICFISSFIFSRYFLQFLTATIILGIKWIVDSKSSKMLIMIYDAWKRGGEREAGRILKELERR